MLSMLAQSALSVLLAELSNPGTGHLTLTEKLYMQLFFDVKYLLRVFEGCWMTGKEEDDVEEARAEDLKAMADKLVGMIRKEVRMMLWALGSRMADVFGGSLVTRDLVSLLAQIDPI